MTKALDPLLRVRDPELQEYVESVNFILNAGHYETPITTTIPDYQSNNGESRVYTNTLTASTGSGILRSLYYYINGLWCSLTFNSSGNASSGFTDHIIDSDGDTLVHTQFNAGENLVRFYSAGTYVVAINTYGISVAPNYKIAFDGLNGDTVWTYSSASAYMQCYLNGSLRMEM